MADKTVLGRFVWHELITPDTAGANAFYAKALGWKTQAWEQDPNYTMFVAPSGPLGGTVGRPSESPRWLPYIGTDHIEGTVDQARSLGARIVTDVTGMPNGGKYALLEDPQGAAFGLYASATEPAPESEPKLGEFSWHELATNDFRAAFDFYSSLFGWEAIAEHDMGAPAGVYFTFGRGGRKIGGMFKRTPDMPGGPSWLGYVRVKDVHKVIEKATSAGASVLTGPMEVPGGDLVAQLNDPQGGAFAVHTVAADVRRAAESANEEAPATAVESTEEQAAAAGAARRKAGKKKAAKKAKKKSSKSKAATRKSAGARKSAKRSAKKKAAAKKKSGKKKAAKKAAPRRAARGATRKAKSAKKRGTAARSAGRSSKAKKSAKRGAAKKKVARRGK